MLFTRIKRQSRNQREPGSRPSRMFYDNHTLYYHNRRKSRGAVATPPPESCTVAEPGGETPFGIREVGSQAPTSRAVVFLLNSRWFSGPIRRLAQEGVMAKSNNFARFPCAGSRPGMIPFPQPTEMHPDRDRKTIVREAQSLGKDQRFPNSESRRSQRCSPHSTGRSRLIASGIGRQGVKPVPPELIAGASTRPVNEGIGTRGPEPIVSL